jgi:hypothetical protein
LLEEEDFHTFVSVVVVSVKSSARIHSAGIGVLP